MASDDWRKRTARVLKKFGAKQLDESTRTILDRIQTVVEEDVRKFCKQLKDGKQDDRIQAAIALGHLGTQAKNAIPTLIETLQVKNKKLRDAVIWALWEMRSISVPHLLEAARTDRHHLGVDCIGRALEGPWINPDLAYLARALEDSDARVRECAARALGGLAGREARILPALFSAYCRIPFLTSGPNFWMWMAIGDIGSAGTRYFYYLLDDEDRLVRLCAFLNMERVLHHDGFLIKHLNERVISETDKLLQELGAKIVESLATEACESLARYCSTLAALAEKGNPSVRAHCKLALQSIRITLPSSIKSLDTSLLRIRRNKRKLKRAAAQRVKELLALLETCLEWPDQPFSRDKVKESDLYKNKRASFGLPRTIAETSIQNYLDQLALYCGLTSLKPPKSKYVSSKLDPGALNKLRATRPILEASMRSEESWAATELQKADLKALTDNTKM